MHCQQDNDDVKTHLPAPRLSHYGPGSTKVGFCSLSYERPASKDCVRILEKNTMFILSKQKVKKQCISIDSSIIIVIIKITHYGLIAYLYIITDFRIGKVHSNSKWKLNANANSTETQRQTQTQNGNSSLSETCSGG